MSRVKLTADECCAILAALRVECEATDSAADGDAVLAAYNSGIDKLKANRSTGRP